jgi:DNA-binding MarR family transcriptional regulator
MKERRRSLRQAEILLQLEEKPAKTISELAERMDALRPSVSRSLRTLKEQGLVYRNHNGWHLTEAGIAEAATARAMLVDMADKVQSMAERTSEVLNRTVSGLIKSSDIAKMMDDVIKPLDISIFPDSLGLASEAAGLSNIAESFERVIKSLNVTMFPETLGLALESAALPDMAEVLGRALKPLLEAQERNSALLGNLAASMQLVGFGEIARRNNLFLASAIDDVFAIHQAEIVQLAAQVGFISTHQRKSVLRPTFL